MASISGPSTIDLADGPPWIYTASGNDTDSADWSVDENGLSVDIGWDGGRCEISRVKGTGSFVLHYTDKTGDSASKTVTVIDSGGEPADIPMESVTIQVSSVSVNVGDSTTFRVSYSPGTATDPGISVTCNNGNVSCSSRKDSGHYFTVTVNANSNAVSGTFTITVRSTDGSNVSDTVTLHVIDDDPVTNISISGPTVANVGDTDSFSASVTGGGENNGVSWSLNGGGSVRSTGERSCQVTWSSSGTWTLTASAQDGSGKSDTHRVTVSGGDEPVVVTSISISSDSTVSVGSTIRATATTSPSNADNRHVTWSAVSAGNSGQFSISNQTDTSTGGYCDITGEVDGTMYLYAYSADSGSAYRRKLITIEEPIIPTTALTVTGATKVSSNRYKVTAPYGGSTPEVKFTRVPSDSDESINGNFSSLNGFCDHIFEGGINTPSRTFEAYNCDTVGTRTVTITSGEVTVYLEIEVEDNPCTNIVLSGVDPPTGDYDGTIRLLLDDDALKFTATTVPDQCSDEMQIVSSGSAASMGYYRSSLDTDVYYITVAPVSEGTTVVTMTAGDVEKTVLVEVTELVLVKLDANGGTFPDGSSVHAFEPADRQYRLPDWSVVDRPGFILSHWTMGNVRGEMGETRSDEGTWVAQWVADTREYNTECLPHAAIRIYRNLSQYIDVTYLQIQGGEAVVDIAENRPGMATFTLLSDITDPSQNLMSEDCALWSSGSDGPIRPGMYVRIDNIRSDGTLSYVMDGFITTVSPNAEQVSVEVGDRITFLGRQGTTLRRNYYGDAGSRTDMFVSAGYDDELYADLSELPAGATPDGTVMWTVQSPKTYNGTEQGDGANSVGDNEPIFEWTFPADGSYLGQVTIGMYLALFGIGADIDFSATISSTGGDTGTATASVTGVNGDFDLTLDFGMVRVSGIVTVTVYSGPQTGELSVRTIATPQSSGNCTYSCWWGSGSSRRWVTLQRDVTSTIMFYALAETVGEIVGTHYIPSNITGVDDLSDSTLYVPSSRRALVPYVASGGQSTIDVLEGISWAMEMMPFCNTSALPASDTLVTIFRTGGGYAQDYIQKLADIASDSGRRRTYRCRGFTTPVLVVGARYMNDDSPVALLHYGGDTPSGSGTRIAFSTFTPRMTLKHRPSLATLRGTISTQGSSESIPLQIAVEDVDSTETRFGVLVETVVADSNVATMGDAGNAVWAALAENDLDQWEGSMVLPDIITTLLAMTGAYAGSGVPVRITDSRNGISNYAARVRQVRLDYNACTTQITLSNYSMAYSSGIADTTAMAITSADVATGDSSTTLFNSQYVRIKTDTAINIGDGTGVTVTGIKSDGTFDFPSVSVYALPNGRHLVHAVAPSSGSGHTANTQMYGVIAVQVGSVQLNIRPSLRPDYYSGQTLSVDIDCP